MEKATNILSEFSPVTLKDMYNKKLPDRTDTKYIFPSSQLKIFLEQLKNEYLILEVNAKRISRFEFLYFDTKKFDLYNQHHCGKLNRYKIRFRKHLESDTNFFEIIFKNNKGQTIKNRIKQKKNKTSLTDKEEVLVKEKTSLNPSHLEAKLWVNHSRITLVNKNFPERVTLDLDLNFKNAEQLKSIKNIVIAEVKQNKALNTPFINLMRNNHIHEGSINKYCFGVITLFNNIKSNNFKSKLTSLKKFNYDTNASA